MHSENKKTEQIITNQKVSLDRWVDYLSSEDAEYPTWAKYWAFTSMVKMGKFEKAEREENGETIESAHFAKRTKDTTASFPVLNSRALAKTMSALQAHLERKQQIQQMPKKIRKEYKVPMINQSTRLDDNGYESLIATEDFSKIYTQFLIEIPEYTTEGLQETRGKWVKYEKNSDPKRLVDSLEGHPLEWCTADLETARTQLQGGDFYVYYSLNEAGKAVIPRLAIRTLDGKIAEPPRGIAPNQNLDPFIGDVLEKKLDEFPDKEQFKKKSADMKRLTEIDKKNSSQVPLTSDDLRFLYEFDAKIEGFGYRKDPRIKELLAGRNIKSDLSLITGYTPDQISLTKDEALSGACKFHYGTISLSGLLSAEGLTLPETINGDLYLSGLQSAEGLTLHGTINGKVDFSELPISEKNELREKFPKIKIY